MWDSFHSKGGGSYAGRYKAYKRRKEEKKEKEQEKISMKSLKWFKIGELIPQEATYIKSEQKVVRYENDYDPMGGIEIPIYEEFHLYEIFEEQNDE